MGKYKCPGSPQHKIVCGREYDTLEGNFYRDRDAVNGFKRRCKKCVLEIAKLHKRKTWQDKILDPKQEKSGDYADHELEHTILIKGEY